VVGADGEDGGPGDPTEAAGAVYVFARDLVARGSWGEVTILHASDAQEFDFFGYGRSIALNMDTLVVGAIGEDGGLGDPLPDAGAIYVFERDLGGPGHWGEAAILLASDAQEEDDFGVSITMDGDTLVVGAHGEDGGSGSFIPLAGAAYAFERPVSVQIFLPIVQR
jgi:hypothetical protein